MGVQINEDRWAFVNISIDLASVAANTTAEQNISVPGVRLGDFVAVNGLARTAGLGVVGARVSANDVVSIFISNNTAAPIDQAAMVALMMVFRPEKKITAQSVVLT